VEPASAIGRAWCLTAVDTLVEQSSVVPWSLPKDMDGNKKTNETWWQD